MKKPTVFGAVYIKLGHSYFVRALMFGQLSLIGPS
jgi:hypothetical protein